MWGCHLGLHRTGRALLRVQQSWINIQLPHMPIGVFGGLELRTFVCSTRVCDTVDHPARESLRRFLLFAAWVHARVGSIQRVLVFHVGVGTPVHRVMHFHASLRVVYRRCRAYSGYRSCMWTVPPLGMGTHRHLSSSAKRSRRRVFHQGRHRQIDTCTDHRGLRPADPV